MAPTLRRRSLTVAVVTVGAAALMAAAPAYAAGVVDPAPIGPGQYFTGLVDNVSSQAVIKVVCPGPVVPGETGHPLAGQTVEALPAAASSASTAGYTGSAADRINVDFGATSTTAPVTLTHWAVQAAIPTSLLLPCSGSGTVVFVPAPASPTAQAATVVVDYANIAD
ncbi:hypothetical protein GXW83_15210 [Streptacidiphilus sp. PB12-B1b]|uniref:hypothetical protein n=1 Tax=Streptacidiphilus sp. PB12-B1b TaxID=2705012 RepID=UPI0015FBC2AD|nr:hypothetical protein [Streptacidiphilus sp. PB12-B1b]QMU76878.1 hypothetical protein GXW83_15210 [Streptacidiphilus sp. PB12-B1b]